MKVYDLSVPVVNGADWYNEPITPAVKISRIGDMAAEGWVSHTVAVAPLNGTTYLETSASAMFVYGMAECRNQKLMDVPHEEALRKAWIGLAAQVDAEGRVIGVSEGTGTHGGDHYRDRRLGTYTWGTGAMLLAAAALAESE